MPGKPHTRPPQTTNFRDIPQKLPEVSRASDHMQTHDRNRLREASTSQDSRASNQRLLIEQWVKADNQTSRCQSVTTAHKEAFRIQYSTGALPLCVHVHSSQKPCVLLYSWSVS